MILTSSIVGTKFHPGAHDKLLHTPAGSEVTLVREPTNEYDPNAIACHVDGFKCGYIPKAQAARLAEDLDNGRVVVAVLKDYNKLEIEVTNRSQDSAPIDDIGDANRSDLIDEL